MQPNWNLINARKREQEENINNNWEINVLLPKFKQAVEEHFKPHKPIKNKFARPINIPFEIRKKIALMMKWETSKVMGLTKGWSEGQLAGSLSDALAFTKNPQGRWQNIRKEINGKRKNTNTK